ncbi:MAG: DUF421 domain-containing protein [Bacillota bacterium]|nr:DUF421 domain-containing protein [Bacillota bacterium]
MKLILNVIIVYITLLILTRILGKKQLNQLTYFNYITGITMGTIAADVMRVQNNKIANFLILVFWSFLTLITGLINLKSGKFRTFVDGKPTIVVGKGKVLRKALQKNRLNMDDLTMMLRENNIFSITEVEYAILEPDGKLSVMKKPQKQQITKEDMKVPTSAINCIPCEIITDGNIIHRNLKELNLNEAWLNDQLKQQNINSAKEVFYAEIQTDGSLFIEKY